MATTASVYNASRMTRQVLKRHRKEGPSLVLHLYTNTFRFERQSGAFLCDSPIKNLLYFIRNQRVPADLIDVFDEARIPFFEGCLIVEVHDHRPPSDSNDSVLPPSQLSHLNGLAHPSTSQSDDEENTPSTSHPTNTSLHGLGGHYGYYGRIGMAARQGQSSPAHGIERPNVYRVVLYPSSDTLWADLKMLEEVDGQGSWSDDDVLHVESKILALTSPPLCLAPDLQATRIANLMLSATALSSAYTPLPSAPHLPIVGQASRKRGINSIEVELDKSNQRRRETILRLMERGSSLRAKDTGAAAAGLVNGAGSQASFSRIGFIEQWRASKAAEARNAARMADEKVNGGVSGGPGAGGLGKDDAQSASGGARAPPAKKKKKKGGKAEEEPEPEREPTPSPPPTKKKPAKKKAQREKEEREKAERERAEREAAAAKAKEEEAAAAAAAAKKKKKPTKKEKEAAAKKEAEAAAAAAAAAIAAAAAENAKKKRAPAKSKKTKGANETSSAAASTPRSQPATTPQQKPLPTPKKQPQPSPRQANQQQQQTQQQQQQQQQAAQQALQQATMAMLSQQQQQQGQNAGFPMLGGVGGFGNGQFGAMNGATGMMMPGQNFQQQQQQQLQLQQQMAIQRALQQAGFQGQQMNGNGGFGMNLQQLQALLAIQQQQQSLQQNMQAQQPQQAQGEQQELPIGVGMGNLPAKWGGNMN